MYVANMSFVPEENNVFVRHSSCTQNPPSVLSRAPGVT